MTTQSNEYLSYMNSSAWQLKRLAVLGRACYICERCKQSAAREVHHLTYARLGDESLEDLQALCLPCHKLADREREYESGLDTYASKRYGDDWGGYDYDSVADEFDRWLEDRSGW